MVIDCGSFGEFGDSALNE